MFQPMCITFSQMVSGDKPAKLPFCGPRAKHPSQPDYRTNTVPKGRGYLTGSTRQVRDVTGGIQLLAGHRLQPAIAMMPRRIV
jgi:hypothetical protein